MKKSLRILVVDDDEDVLEALSDLIREDADFQLVGAVKSVAEGVEIAAAERPHLALVDVRMPDGGGARLAGVLAAVSPHTRVVAHSAADDLGSVREMVAAGVRGYLAKGRAATNILATLRGVARGEEVFQVPSGLMRELGDTARPVLDEASFPAGLLFVTPDARIAAANQAFCELIGYSEQELVGTDVRALTHPDDSAVTDLYQKLATGEIDRIRVEKRYLAKSGEEVWGDHTSTLVRDAAGCTPHIQTVVLDITERKRAEAALHESEQVFRGLVEGIPGFVYRCAPDEVASTEYVSPQVEELFGFTPAEYMADPNFWVDIIHPADRDEVVAEFTTVAKTGGVFEREYRICDRAGSVRWVRDHAITVRDRDNRPLYCQGIMLDITDSKQAELERAANLSKSRFLASMSHELRTPLNSVLGFAQLLGSADFGALNERQERYVGHIQSAGEHLLNLVNDILDLSKVEAGQMEFESIPVAVQSAIGEVVERFAPMAGARQVELEVKPGPAVAALGDPRRLNQVLMNLLSNAIKFTPAGGRVTLEARGRPGRVEIAVADTGIGIPEDQLEAIFDEFTQVRKRLGGAPEGTGLGLALTRSMVESMGGRVTVASQEGSGSTFTVVLPAPPPAAA